MFKIVDSVDREKWSNFVKENPRGNVFQTPEMADVYKGTRKLKPVTLFAVKNEEIYASLVAYISSEKGGVFKKISSRAIIHGGPIFKENKDGVKALSVLMDNYDNLVSKEAIFTEIRVVSDTPEFSSLDKRGYKHEEHLNYLIDLKRPLEDVWKNVKKSRRYGVKKSKEANVKVECVKDKNLVRNAYDLLLDTYRNAKLPIADISMFESAFDILDKKDMIKFFLAKHGNKYIGTIVILTYNGVAYDWYAGASRDALNLYPNDRMAWHAIESSLESGYDVFDFGGAGKPNEKYGVREFKKQFGGDLVNLGRYKKIYSPRKLKIAQGGFKIYRKLKR